MQSDQPAAKPLSANEGLKAASNFLRGNLAREIADTSTGSLSEGSTQLTKFHGFYLQDDRDLRAERRKQKLEKAFSFMLRVRLPGGRATPQQWLALDQLADETANGMLRLTTRQTFQFYGVQKTGLRPLIRGMARVMLDSIAACGDVNRNVMAAPNPERSAAHAAVYEHARAFSEFALPRTRAYHELWIDGELAEGGEPDVEPLYGATYLPRKFKVGFAVPPSNDVDVYSQDLGFIGIVEEGRLVGYNVSVGGGMGMSHGNPETFARLGEVIGFITPDQVNAVGAAVMTTQRDHGDRTNRKHARFKYTVQDRGLAWIKAEVERRSGIVFGPARAAAFTTIEDPHGWHRGTDGTWFYGLHILSGRIKDAGSWRMRSALREVARVHDGDFRLTPSQNVIISGASDAAKARIDAVLAAHGVAGENNRTRLRLNALSCVSLPTCGLALAESERALPDILRRFEELLEECGLSDDAISLRVTGCPNGCARPFLGEIALVGKAPGKYALYLGARYNGTRLNRLFAASVTVDEAVALLGPVIRRYALERSPGEEFGDFCHARILPADATLHSTGTPGAAAMAGA